MEIGNSFLVVPAIPGTPALGGRPSGDGTHFSTAPLYQSLANHVSTRDAERWPRLPPGRRMRRVELGYIHKL
jgi:hypothetical protein